MAGVVLSLIGKLDAYLSIVGMNSVQCQGNDLCSKFNYNLIIFAILFDADLSNMLKALLSLA